MACFLLESNRKICEPCFDDKSRRAVAETAGTRFLEDGIVYFLNKSRPLECFRGSNSVPDEGAGNPENGETPETILYRM
jgi:hypothetical protein